MTGSLASGPMVATNRSVLVTVLTAQPETMVMGVRMPNKTIKIHATMVRVRRARTGTLPASGLAVISDTNCSVMGKE